MTPSEQVTARHPEIHGITIPQVPSELQRFTPSILSTQAREDLYEAAHSDKIKARALIKRLRIGDGDQRDHDRSFRNHPLIRRDLNAYESIESQLIRKLKMPGGKLSKTDMALVDALQEAGSNLAHEVVFGVDIERIASNNESVGGVLTYMLLRHQQDLYARLLAEESGAEEHQLDQAALENFERQIQQFGQRLAHIPEVRDLIQQLPRTLRQATRAYPQLELLVSERIGGRNTQQSRLQLTQRELLSFQQHEENSGELPTPLSIVQEAYDRYSILSRLQDGQRITGVDLARARFDLLTAIAESPLSQQPAFVRLQQEVQHAIRAERDNVSQPISEQMDTWMRQAREARTPQERANAERTRQVLMGMLDGQYATQVTTDLSQQLRIYENGILAEVTQHVHIINPIPPSPDAVTAPLPTPEHSPREQDIESLYRRSTYYEELQRMHNVHNDQDEDALHLRNTVLEAALAIDITAYQQASVEERRHLLDRFSNIFAIYGRTSPIPHSRLENTENDFILDLQEMIGRGTMLRSTHLQAEINFFVEANRAYEQAMATQGNSTFTYEQRRMAFYRLVGRLENFQTSVSTSPLRSSTLTPPPPPPIMHRDYDEHIAPLSQTGRLGGISASGLVDGDLHFADRNTDFSQHTLEQLRRDNPTLFQQIMARSALVALEGEQGVPADIIDQLSVVAADLRTIITGTHLDTAPALKSYFVKLADQFWQQNARHELSTEPGIAALSSHAFVVEQRLRGQELPANSGISVEELDAQIRSAASSHPLAQVESFLRSRSTPPPADILDVIGQHVGRDIIWAIEAYQARQRPGSYVPEGLIDGLQTDVNNTDVKQLANNLTQNLVEIFFSTPDARRGDIMLGITDNLRQGYLASLSVSQRDQERIQQDLGVIIGEYLLSVDVPNPDVRGFIAAYFHIFDELRARNRQSMVQRFPELYPPSESQIHDRIMAYQAAVAQARGIDGLREQVDALDQVLNSASYREMPTVYDGFRTLQGLPNAEPYFQARTGMQEVLDGLERELQLGLQGRITRYLTIQSPTQMGRALTEYRESLHDADSLPLRYFARERVLQALRQPEEQRTSQVSSQATAFFPASVARVESRVSTVESISVQPEASAMFMDHIRTHEPEIAQEVAAMALTTHREISASTALVQDTVNRLRPLLQSGNPEVRNAALQALRAYGQASGVREEIDITPELLPTYMSRIIEGLLHVPAAQQNQSLQIVGQNFTQLVVNLAQTMQTASPELLEHIINTTLMINRRVFNTDISHTLEAWILTHLAGTANITRNGQTEAKERLDREVMTRLSQAVAQWRPTATPAPAAARGGESFLNGNDMLPIVNGSEEIRETSSTSLTTLQKVGESLLKDYQKVVIRPETTVRQPDEFLFDMFNITRLLEDIQTVTGRNMQEELERLRAVHEVAYADPQELQDIRARIVGILEAYIRNEHYVSTPGIESLQQS